MGIGPVSRTSSFRLIIHWMLSKVHVTRRLEAGDGRGWAVGAVVYTERYANGLSTCVRTLPSLPAPSSKKKCLLDAPPKCPQ